MHEHHNHNRLVATSFAALLSVCSNLFLTICKIVVGLCIGSLAVVSEGLHSAVDVIASLTAWVSVKLSNKPADDKYTYGYGKFEDLSAVFEAGIIIAVALGVIWTAIEDIDKGPSHLGWGIVAMMVSIVVNGLISRYLYNVADEHDSLALEADAWHLSADVLTSVGVLIGLVLVSLTGYKWFDPLAAICVSLYIISEGRSIAQTGLNNLLDKSLPQKDIDKIKCVLSKYPDVSYNLRSRKAGPVRHIDVDIVVAESYNVVEVSTLIHELEHELEHEFHGADIVVRQKTKL